MKTKSLKDMTLTELWELFPIVLVSHQEAWANWFIEEKEFLQTLAPNALISHIGSTAIPEILSKPTVDILMEFSSEKEMQTAANRMENNGYIRMAESFHRISLNKGYTENGYAEKVFHFHLRLAGDNAEIKFRDFLCEHPAIAKKYETLKIELATKYKHNRDAYTEGKTAFIKSLPIPHE